MIPNILWQTWKTKDIPEKLKHMVQSWDAFAPELEKKFMDDQEAAAFILKHFGDETYSLYVALPQAIMRADFWRLAVVYIYGGYYADLDVILHQRFFNLIPNNVEVMFAQEGAGLSNWMFGAIPKHPAFKKAIEWMLKEAKQVNFWDVQNFGMHPINQTLKDHYDLHKNVNMSHKNIFLWPDVSIQPRGAQTIQHLPTSFFGHTKGEAVSWRVSQAIRLEEDKMSENILFFTTFHKAGYELYGSTWVNSFISLANYYTKFKAIVYYQGFEPNVDHPNITWIDYDQTFLEHEYWKLKYLASSKHSSYIKTNTVRFSHKAFVISHVLLAHQYDYMIWLDGDVVFQKDSYKDFPLSLLQQNFLACQLEHNHPANHIESGVLIFDGTHKDTRLFAEQFQEFYNIEHINSMHEPYDGFVIFKTLNYLQLKFTDLNKQYGRGGIQSDPNETFLHPEIKSKFTHNIGLTGKQQYAAWDEVKHKSSYIRDLNKNVRKVVLVSGGFDPLGEDDIAYMKAAKKMGQVLCLALHSDDWLIRHKGKKSLDWKERSKLVRSLNIVDYVIDFDDVDNTAKDAIKQTRQIFPSAKIIFANRGEKTVPNTLEQEIDVRGVSFVFNVGR